LIVCYLLSTPQIGQSRAGLESFLAINEKRRLESGGRHHKTSKNPLSQRNLGKWLVQCDKVCPLRVADGGGR
jgi:hypothetical protein